MKPAKNKWPTTENGKSILFVAQAMRELLAVDSFESFRSMALGTISRIDEAIKVSEDVQKNRIPAKAIDPIFHELEWSFKRDIVARKLLNHEMSEFQELIRPGNVDIRTVLHFLHFVRKRILPIYKKILRP